MRTVTEPDPLPETESMQHVRCLGRRHAAISLSLAGAQQVSPAGASTNAGHFDNMGLSPQNSQLFFVGEGAFSREWRQSPRRG
jgi:hypothetical protein